MEVKAGNSVVELVQGDITELDTEAIVNAANAQLKMGGGVAGAIRRKGGPAIQAECDKIGGTFVGGAAITTGGNLKARHVIHAVGPRMGEGGRKTPSKEEDRKLRNATLNSLRVADENKIKSISFPAISTGVFGYPIGRCANIMLGTTIDYLRGEYGEVSTTIEKVVFCLYTPSDYSVFEETMKRFL